MTQPRRTLADRLAAIFVEPEPRRRAAAATGLLLTAFAVAHCAFALTWLWGAPAFDGLALALRRPLAMRAVEMALALVLALHVVLSFAIVAEERRRPVAERRVRATRTLAATGVMLAVFLVWHLTRLRFAIRPDTYGDLDFHGAVGVELRDPRGALAYLAAAGVLGLHVALGLRASLDAWWPSSGRTLARVAASWLVGLALAAGYGWVALAAWLYY